ncbi:hypothetical protein T492DRAFT_848742 [Pavlovales sp. CCMP2436]|nr:hypothetical protein T492DRAFT_848742 [Pavlovales sp. CCMP2436]
MAAAKTAVAAKNGANGKKKVQHEEEALEFGGPWGVLGIMIFSHFLIYYCWICLTYYDAGVAYPTGFADVLPFCGRMIGHIYEGAFPTWYATKIYWTFLTFEAFLQFVCPGVMMKGLPLEQKKKKKKNAVRLPGVHDEGPSARAVRLPGGHDEGPSAQAGMVHHAGFVDLPAVVGPVPLVYAHAPLRSTSHELR